MMPVWIWPLSGGQGRGRSLEENIARILYLSQSAKVRLGAAARSGARRVRKSPFFYLTFFPFYNAFAVSLKGRLEQGTLLEYSSKK